MRTYSKITPEGARDLLFEECRARREVQAKLSQVFTLRGYREVITPGLEYFDVFNLPGAAIPQQEMYKCTDNHGRLVVFRPDSTLPIARMAASRLRGGSGPCGSSTARPSTATGPTSPAAATSPPRWALS